MRKTIIAVVAALGIALAASTPAKAQFWGGYGGWGGYYGGWGYGGAAIAGMAVGGLIAGAIASQSYGYGYGGYGYGYGYPAYAAPVYSSPRVRKQIIIKNSPGARVYEEDDIFGW